MKRTEKLLPILLVALLAACGKKEEAPQSQAPASEPPAASAPSTAPSSSATAGADTSTPPAASSGTTGSAPSASESAGASSSPPASTSSASGASPAGSTPSSGAAPGSASDSASASGASSSGASAGGGDLALGEKTYTATCVACHGAGVLGAPKLGDKAAWGPRIAQGKDTLYNHALHGIRQMPPKGGNAALKDADVKAAVDYMVSKSS